VIVVRGYPFHAVELEHLGAGPAVPFFAKLVDTY
jgi:hypothetical protein